MVSSGGSAFVQHHHYYHQGVQSQFLEGRHLQSLSGEQGLRKHCPEGTPLVTRYGARMGGSKSNAVNLILRLFLYHILHMMSS